MTVPQGAAARSVGVSHSETGSPLAPPLWTARRPQPDTPVKLLYITLARLTEPSYLTTSQPKRPYQLKAQVIQSHLKGRFVGYKNKVESHEKAAWQLARHLIYILTYSRL